MLKTEMLKSKRHHSGSLARIGLFSLSAFQLFSFLLCPPAFAHDPLEISATVYLHTNRLELRAVMTRKTILLAADRQAVPLLDFSIPAEREEALPMLRSLAPGLFTLTCGTNVLTATGVRIIIGAEDHVGFDFTFTNGWVDQWIAGSARDTTNRASEPSRHPTVQSSSHPPTLRLDARILAQLPKQDPYGVSVTVLNLVNNEVITQQLLSAQSPTIAIMPRQIIATNQPPAAQKPAPLLP